MKHIRVAYFASLREQRGLASETVETDVLTVADLYEELRVRHGFTLQPALVQFAVNDGFRTRDTVLAEGDEVVFIPPVAGG